mmetsp:Transcript_40858/g.95857  ORF Transcript_40858/g.95857 Transcript_40858/m.95857 type:complete len:464 (-) Transcript_40858:386-1777(-)|eukprot:CAMPEP_0113308508 /NCGR_PEP_ID=MMETSP0010_2-20120614/6925_1 /TAXON_ID=216773 ORGANISM="Corethron hystrix, Strain 308" /NCGR_SAMPLE_ID=MMETSP0010_2 /ASSEMBLY_ACC=CAM_ASM_000155 /LENGTH=463 /DNA_ID=CAMNT_0000163577 /DNA_START=269 /DNA_END=1660 /DNA_ORIENTATION=- /assembly_acc=CAM_ASM_000155
METSTSAASNAVSSLSSQVVGRVDVPETSNIPLLDNSGDAVSETPGMLNRSVTDTEEGNDDDDGTESMTSSAMPRGSTDVGRNNDNADSDLRSPAAVEDDAPDVNDCDDGDMSDYSYEDEDDALAGGFLVAESPLPQSQIPPDSARTDSKPLAGHSSGPLPSLQSTHTSSSTDVAAPSVGTGSSAVPAAHVSNVVCRKRPWQEPSRAAVTMSLRAEREHTGGRRRLASDLYQILSGQTSEQGFSIEPASEDSLSRWRIKLFGFDEDSDLSGDMKILGIDHIELEMTFPDQYPFEPPFARVVRPRFVRQTGFVMDGALCMELLTPGGWNPVNNIESVIVSIRSLLVVGDGRLAAALPLHEKAAKQKQKRDQREQQERGRAAEENESYSPMKVAGEVEKKSKGALAATSKKNDPHVVGENGLKKAPSLREIGGYSAVEARAAYSHLSDYHKKKGWDTSGWWAKKG